MLSSLTPQRRGPFPKRPSGVAAVTNAARSFASVDVLNAVALVVEAARMSKVYPAVLAFVDTPWRTASAFIVRDVRCRWAALRDNEGVVHFDLLRA